jgi:hypothetical protein
MLRDLASRVCGSQCCQRWREISIYVIRVFAKLEELLFRTGFNPVPFTSDCYVALDYIPAETTGLRSVGLSNLFRQPPMVNSTFTPYIWAPTRHYRQS